MGETATATLFTPLTLRGRTLRNRVVISPMCQHAGRNGHATDWHLVHYGKFVLGGAGLVFTESTAIASDSRVGIDDLGIWSDDHIPGLKRLADFAHANGGLMGVQIAHSGRKAFSQPLWHGGQALSAAEIEAAGIAWRRVGPSAIAAGPEWGVPQALSADEIAEIVAQHVDAARRADAADMDAIELHYGHGYLVASFLSPIANQRQDAYGGTLENRMRLAVEIAAAVRAVWPADKPLFARLSCVDGAEGGWGMDDTVVLAARLKAVGVDVIDCSSGGLSEETRRSNVPRGFGFQVPFAARVRAEVGVPTQAVGLITSPAQAEEIVARGQADLVAIGRAALQDPYWPAAARRALTGEAGYTLWPERHAAWLDKREPVLRRLIAEQE
ncbi:NADH:flavin oxidoreductase/NADH oxidase [Pseudodonghicola flavimaris]|uniref:NADH:flavin oxidoreductase/NADH oxidase n=1 Tax=Pseudodonghicola flavimaris TaxID=3050036 RepID=A0ABT7F1B1_9RHOB|nr:NADH:flavin oxidoreductase/NADH oxidase [Pseudodonghicola flavimaris]MDK3018392.1 NADH:flavin oxidoreductase/NADH oxidase [Pseudodonghicola flavimaris]